MNPNSDFKDLLSTYNDFDVRYLIVGGYALMLYVEPRFAQCLEVWVEASDLNASRVFAALAQFGAPLKGLSPADFAQTGVVYQVGVPPARIDILMSVTGVDFPSAWENRKMTAHAGLAVPCMSRADLIKNKRATGRPQDCWMRSNWREAEWAAGLTHSPHARSELLALLEAADVENH